MARRWPPWLEDGHHDLVGPPVDAFGVTSEGKSTPRKVAALPRAWCHSSMYRGYLQFKSRAFIKRLRKSLSSGGFCFKFFFGVHPVLFSAQPWPFPLLDRRVRQF